METAYQIRCWLYNHRGPGFVVELREADDGSFELLRQDETEGRIDTLGSSGVIDSTRDVHRKQLARSAVLPLIERLAEQPLPSVPSITRGLDGVTYHVRIQNGRSIARYSWWLDCPSEWQPLREFWERLTELSRL